MAPQVFADLGVKFKDERLFIKIHDAYVVNSDQQPIVPTGVTLCALYFIRNPLDIAGSFANHNGVTIDEAIKLMNDPQGSLAKQPGNLNINSQFRQLMLTWSEHVKSWTNNLPFEVMIIRYEDMLEHSLSTFSKAMVFMGFNADKGQIQKAISESSFERLKEQEKNKGFLEKNHKSKLFFRNGTSGNWINELTPKQTEAIIKYNGEIMEKYNYTLNKQTVQKNNPM